MRAVAPFNPNLTYPLSHRRVTNMEGGHKPSCLQGKAKSKVRRGTNPFRVNRAKEKDVSWLR